MMIFMVRFFRTLLFLIITLLAGSLSAVEMVSVPASETVSPTVTEKDSVMNYPLITAERMAKKGLTSKVNVTTVWDAEPEMLGVKMDATEFNFGWFHVPMPKMDYAEIAGIYGQFRVPDGERGRWWISAMILIPHSGEKSEYYVQEIGISTDSRGECVEFYLPFSQFSPQRDARKNRVTAELLKQTALL
ncbi:MAG: hypothetical protein Q4C70_12975, partial [Planctomycetia bacterium]|nr:hypothetical protein [Planctomycetia bacterium]